MNILLALPRRALIALAVVLALALAASVVLLRLPQVTVTVVAATERREIVQEIILSTAVDDPDFVQFKLPAQVVEATAARERTVERTGAARHDDFARGTVVLRNELDEVQELLPKTHLRHEASGVYFLTDRPVAVPAHGEVAMPVTAKERGPAGNVPPGRLVIDKLPATTQQSVYAESNAPMSGGVAVDDPVSETELRSAREEIVQAARDEVRGQLTAVAGGAPLREELINYEEVETLVGAEVGSKTASFMVKTIVRGRAFIADETNLLGLAALKLREAASANEVFATYDLSSFSLGVLRSDFARGEAVVQGKLTGTFARKLGPASLAGRNLAGLSAGEVRERLQQEEGVGEVEVSFWPFWVTSVPGNSERVEIVVKSQ